MSCKKDGPPDGRVASGSSKKRVTLRIPMSEFRKDVELLTDVDHQTSNAWERWRKDVDREFNKLLKDVQREAAGVRDQLVETAKKAGFKAVGGSAL